MSALEYLVPVHARTSQKQNMAKLIEESKPKMDAKSSVFGCAPERLKSLRPSPSFGAGVFWVLVMVFVSGESLFPALWIDTFWYEVTWKVCLNGVIALWVYLDASARNWSEERTRFYALFSMMLTEIVVPVYLVKSRGWKQAGLSVLRFLFRFCIFLLALTLLEYAYQNIGN